ncbi:MAG: DUF4252 domain-containing protein [Flavobacteriales bacterium]
MKNTITILFTLCLTLSTWAQTNTVNKVFNQFLGKENISEVSVSSKMFALFGYIDAETKEDKETLEAIKSVKSLYLLSTDNKEEADKMREESKKIDHSKFEPLMTVKDGEDNINFMIKESNGIITELIMLVDSDSSFVAMSLTGNIDLEKLSKLSALKMGGLDKLKDIDK